MPNSTHRFGLVSRRGNGRGNEIGTKSETRVGARWRIVAHVGATRVGGAAPDDQQEEPRASSARAPGRSLVGRCSLAARCRSKKMHEAQAGPRAQRSLLP